MMDWMIVILHVNALLPLTEAVQAVVCMMGDFQILLIMNDSIKYIKEICIYIYVQYASMKIGLSLKCERQLENTFYCSFY